MLTKPRRVPVFFFHRQAQASQRAVKAEHTPGCTQHRRLFRPPKCGDFFTSQNGPGKINKLLQGERMHIPQKMGKGNSSSQSVFWELGYVIVPRRVWLLFCYLGCFVHKKLIHLTSSMFIDVANNIRVFGIIHLTMEKRAKISTHGCPSFLWRTVFFGGIDFHTLCLINWKFDTLQGT